MNKKENRKNLHVRLDSELYEKIRQISFYQQQSMTYIINRLINEYVEEYALEEPELTSPPIL